MNSNPKPARTRSRGLILTEEALKFLNEELRKWWENAGAKHLSEKGKIRKLSREAKAEGLGLTVNTVDKLYGRKPVDEITLRTAFDKLNIIPRFSKERYCVSDASPSGNLPYVSTRCIGRETQVAEIKAFLESTPLVTLTGAGGVGKTRLVIQVAEEMKSRFAAGVWFVELAGAADPAVVPQRVATTLGVQEEQERPLIQTLADFLRGKPLLLILDNCEHLLEACAMLADHLLSSSSRLRVLATSRERLNIPSERPFRVPSLAAPDLKRLPGEKEDIAKLLRDCDSVRLFEERAKIQRPDFAVTNQNALLLASICHRLDGIPLAIELAAARIRAMSIDDLERGLSDCFRLLTGGSRAAFPHQQTLRATMDWSYNLLEEKQQALLRRLSVFADGCRLEAAEQVCAGGGIEEWEVLDLLTSLVDKSLAVYQEREGKARYHLLETIRQYSAEKLEESGATEQVRGRHRDCFLRLAEEASTFLTGPQQQEWLDRLEAEHDNLRAACELCRKELDDKETPWRMGSALGRYWEIKCHFSEGRNYLETLLKNSNGVSLALRANILYAAGRLARFQGDFDQAFEMLEESRSLYKEADDMLGVANALMYSGMVAMYQGKREEGLWRYEESRKLFLQLGDKQGLADVLDLLAYAMLGTSDINDVQALFAKSLTLCRATGNRYRIAHILIGLGTVVRMQGELVHAGALFSEALEIFQQIGNRSGIAAVPSNLASMIGGPTALVASHSNHERSLQIYQELGDNYSIAEMLFWLALLECKQGRYEQAQERLNEAVNRCGDRNERLSAMIRFGQGTLELHLGHFAQARLLTEQSLNLRELRPLICVQLGLIALHLGEYEEARERLTEAWNDYRPYKDRNGIVEALNGLGLVHCALGDFTAAYTCYRESLTMLEPLDHFLITAECFEGLAWTAWGLGHTEYAARLLGAATTLRDTVGAPRPRCDKERYNRVVAGIKVALSETAFETALNKGRMFSLNEAVRDALQWEGVAADSDELRHIAGARFIDV